MNDTTVRWFRPGDRNGFLELYRQVFESDPDTEWFAWKYERNPYVDHIPIVVAEHDGTLVGARSFFALEMRVDGERRRVLQPCDTMVHAEHRRRGLLVRMTERAIGRYESTHKPFFFNFPNDKTLAGNLKLGWHLVGTVPTYYRVENLRRVVGAMTDFKPARVASRVGETVVSGYNTLRARNGHTSSDSSVQRLSAIPVDELASLYRAAVPTEIHAVRDETFYEWRFENPHWAYTTYLATDGTKPTAGIVVGESVDSEFGLVRILDVVPLCCSEREAETSALLDRIVSAHSDAGLFAAAACGIGESLLRSFAFHSDSTRPFSSLFRPTNHVVRPLCESTVAESGATLSANWCLTFAEQDTS